MLRRLLIVVLVTACSGKAKPTDTAAPLAPAPAPEPAGSAAPAPAPAPVSGLPVEKRSLADVGLEPASLDRSVDPCVDFFQYACGGWLKSTEIPADRARWGRFSEIDERNKASIKQLLEDDTKGGDAAAKKLGDYYSSCMDE